MMMISILAVILYLLLCLLHSQHCCTSSPDSSSSSTTTSTTTITSPFQYTPFTGFELMFPRPIDTLIAIWCDHDFCIYPVVIGGWFWHETDWKREDLSYYVHVESSIANIKRDVKVGKMMLSEEGFLAVQFNFKLKLPVTMMYTDLQLTLKNKHDAIVYKMNTQVTLIHRRDVFLPNHMQLYQNYLKFNGLLSHNNASQVQHKPKLDFIEIGTSDFAAAIQQAARLQQQSSQRIIYGISMEPMLQYQTRLPDVDGVFKLNAAIDLSKNVGDVQEIFYLPSHFTYSINSSFLRGCSQIDGLHPYALRIAATSKLPAFVFQKMPVKTFRIPQILDRFIHPYFEGINLLKIDIEGMDQDIVKEVISYYSETHNDSRVNDKWPCVMYFETNEWSGYRSDSLMGELKNIGYNLLHDVGLRNNSILHAYKQQMQNESLLVGAEEFETFAFNCYCGEENRRIALELLQPSPVDQNFLSYYCKHSIENIIEIAGMNN